MTIQFVGAASANATSVAIPAHQSGDLLVIAAYCNASATTPTIPNNWIGAISGGGSSNYLGVFWLEATSAAMTSGAWTGVDHLICSVYRPSTGRRLAVSRATGMATGTGGIGAAIAYNSLLDIGVPADAWMVGVAGHRSNDTDIEVAPSGFTNRSFTAGGSAGELALHDSNASAASNSSVNYVLTAGTSSNYRSCVLQISEYEAASGGSGGPLVFGRLVA